MFYCGTNSFSESTIKILKNIKTTEIFSVEEKIRMIIEANIMNKHKNRWTDINLYSQLTKLDIF